MNLTISRCGDRGRRGSTLAVHAVHADPAQGSTAWTWTWGGYKGGAVHVHAPRSAQPSLLAGPESARQVATVSDDAPPPPAWCITCHRSATWSCVRGGHRLHAMPRSGSPNCSEARRYSDGHTSRRSSARSGLIPARFVGCAERNVTLESSSLLTEMRAPAIHAVGNARSKTPGATGADNHTRRHTRDATASHGGKSIPPNRCSPDDAPHPRRGDAGVSRATTVVFSGRGVARDLSSGTKAAGSLVDASSHRRAP